MSDEIKDELDTEGHVVRMVEDAGETDGHRVTRQVEDAGETEGHRGTREIQDAGEDDVEGHRVTRL